MAETPSGLIYLLYNLHLVRVQNTVQRQPTQYIPAVLSSHLLPLHNYPHCSPQRKQSPVLVPRLPATNRLERTTHGATQGHSTLFGPAIWNFTRPAAATATASPLLLLALQ
jgi:hypothetical protein